MASAPSIPLDIIDLIMVELRYDAASLKRCALACHALLSLARRHLFFKICLCSGSVCVKLSHILEQDPHISCYVRQLSLEIGDTSRTGSGSSILDQHIALAAILTSLSSHLHFFQYTSYMRGGCSFMLMPSNLQAALTHIFESPNLEEIVTYGFHDLPFESLKLCSRLQRLDVEGHLYNRHKRPGSGHHTRVGPHHPWALQSLAIDCRFCMDLIISSGCSFPGLRTLSVGRRISLANMMALVSGSQRTLERMNLQLWLDDKPENIHGIDSVDLSNLKECTISVCFLAGPSPFLACFASLFSGGVIATPRALEAIDLGFAFPLHLAADAVVGFCTDGAWAVLDRALTQPRYTKLRNVNLRFRPPPMYIDQVDPAESTPLKEILAQMPSLRSSSKFKVEWAEKLITNHLEVHPL